MDNATRIFEQHRPELFRLAYHMLGRVSESKDILQDAYLKWQNVEVDRIKNKGAYLSTVVSRLCLDRMKSAQYRREEYIGPDLPEPLTNASEETPEDHARLADSLSMAVLFMLQELNPLQRAVFILREVFSYPYAEIAEMVEKSESHCRKIAQRARNRISDRAGRFKTDRQAHQKLLETFSNAVKLGNMQQLETLLSKEAILYSDGGGKVTAARKPIFGANSIARFLIGISQKAPEDITVSFSLINGEPGLQIYFGDKMQSVWTVRTWDGQITEIYAVLNPDKLEHMQK